MLLSGLGSPLEHVRPSRRLKPPPPTAGRTARPECDRLARELCLAGVCRMLIDMVLRSSVNVGHVVEYSMRRHSGYGSTAIKRACSSSTMVLLQTIPDVTPDKVRRDALDA